MKKRLIHLPATPLAPVSGRSIVQAVPSRLQKSFSNPQLDAELERLKACVLPPFAAPKGERLFGLDVTGVRLGTGVRQPTAGVAPLDPAFFFFFGRFRLEGLGENGGV